jgi:outer membrane protein assembly factor BamB
VAFGRVYMGNTDGRMYSFGARTGALAWATSTGGYVYGSAAVADPKGIGPTVYAGSYDGNLYAFNAQSGAVRWSHPSGGKISGSANVLGNVVYYSDLGARTTIGLNATTGSQVMEFGDGAFAAVVADDRAIYLVGYTRIYQMLPTRKSRPRARRKPSHQAARTHRRPAHHRRITHHRRAAPRHTRHAAKPRSKARK